MQVYNNSLLVASLVTQYAGHFATENNHDSRVELSSKDDTYVTESHYQVV